jgi:hypothetical protein
MESAKRINFRRKRFMNNLIFTGVWFFFAVEKLDLKIKRVYRKEIEVTENK